MKKIGRFGGFAILSAVLLFSCNGKKNAAAASESNDELNEQVFAVNAYKTSEGNLDDYLEFGGDVAAVNSVGVMPDMAGKISRVLVSVGDLVKKDQVIAYVDASRAGMNYAASPVKSPISGRITALPITVGTTVSQSSSVATVAQTDDLEIKISIAERFISRIETNQQAVVKFDAYPSVEFNATVFEVSPVLDTNSRTMSVKLRFDEKDSRIKVGMYARVRLVTESIKNAIVIPSAAVITRDGKPYVFTLGTGGGSRGRGAGSGANATARLTPITLGLSVDNKTEITKGLSAGDEIIIKGQSLLSDGAKVNVVSVSQAE